MSPNLKRIAFVNPHSDPFGKIGEPDCGGQCIVEKELMKHLTALRPDLRVDSFTRHFGNKPESEAVNDRATVYRIPCGGPGFIRKEDLYEHLPEFEAGVLACIKKNGRSYDLLHGHYADGGLAAGRLAGSLKIPFVFTAHSLGRVKQQRLPGHDEFLTCSQQAIWHIRVLFDNHIRLV